MLYVVYVVFKWILVCGRGNSESKEGRHTVALGISLNGWVEVTGNSSDSGRSSRRPSVVEH